MVKKLLRLITPIINGAVFGAVNVIPGVSSGTMLVVFGCYDIVCGAFALDFKHIRKHLAFLVPFGIGAAAGLGGAVFALKSLFENHPIPTFMFFMGLISGSFPLIIRKLRSEEKLKTLHVILGIIALALVAALSIIGKNIGGAAEAAVAGTDVFFIALIFISSFIAAAAMIIPGISGAFMLTLFGTYYIILNALTELDTFILIPAAAGMAAGFVLGARGIKLLLSRFHTATYAVITGLVIGSLYAIFPEGVKFDLTLVVGAGVFLAGAALSLILGRQKGEDT